MVFSSYLVVMPLNPENNDMKRCFVLKKYIKNVIMGQGKEKQNKHSYWRGKKRDAQKLLDCSCSEISKYGISKTLCLVEDNVLWVGFSFMTSDRILNSLFFVDWPLGISASPNVPLGSKENSCLKICLTCAKRICQSDSCLWSQGTFLCQ